MSGIPIMPPDTTAPQTIIDEATAPTPITRLAEVLEYLRANGYSVKRLAVGDISVEMADAGLIYLTPPALNDDEDVPAKRKPKAKKAAEPMSIYQQYGADLMPPSEDDDDA